MKKGMIELTVKIALQLYTIRRGAKADPVGTIRQVAKAGYAGVEFAGYYDIPAGEMKALLNENGLAAAGSHVSWTALSGDTENQLRYADEIGLRNLTIPSFGENEFLDEQTLAEVERVRKAAEKHGIALSFHNHFREFAKENGVTRLDLFYSRLPAMKVELDTYWAAFAGEDPLKLMEQYKSRLFTLHIKDMQKDAKEDSVNPNIGEGCLPIRDYLKKAGEAGLEWAVVEMDRCDGGELDCALATRKNLAAWGY
jgi:Sugar phosphate isomerases/epimerases